MHIGSGGLGAPAACLVMPTLNWIGRVSPVAALLVMGCLGADSVSSDAGSFPRIVLRQEKPFLDVMTGSSVGDKLFLDRYNYNNYIKLHADTVPSGMNVTFVPPDVSASAHYTAVNVAVADGIAPGAYRVVIRGSGVVVRSATIVYIVQVQ